MQVAQIPIYPIKLNTSFMLGAMTLDFLSTRLATIVRSYFQFLIIYMQILPMLSFFSYLEKVSIKNLAFTHLKLLLSEI